MESLSQESSQTAIAYLDGPRFARGLSAGIRRLFLRRDYINRINVFPVPDGDTGTNMAFTFKSILESLGQDQNKPLEDVINGVTDAALDGARGNSGAIMAQFFQGFRESVSESKLLTASGLAQACQKGAEQAWTAMSEPVAGTLPTVLDDFAAEISHRTEKGARDIRKLLRNGLERARKSLANTPNQLAVLKQHGVVDAGGQGFVDLLEGIWAFTDKGKIDELAENMTDLESVEFDVDLEIGDHRYCTECVIDGDNLDRIAIMRRLDALDSSSLVVAGSPKRIRVHVHVNNPADVYLACEGFGEITQQKADDMKRQHGLMNQQGKVAIVVDSGADLPTSEVERLGINVVPVRLSFGDREYLDGVSLKPEEFYRMLEESDELPQTSQPPARDFKRVYTLLASHGYQVFSVGLSGELSGTTQAARSAAERMEDADIRVFDTLNASSGQGLLAITAAEAAAQGMSSEEIESLMLELAPQTQTIAIPEDLGPAVRGGRVPGWLKRISDTLHVTPILMAKKGKMGLGGVSFGKGVNTKVLARNIIRRMASKQIYRVLIAHVDNAEAARQVRQLILEGHPEIHSCHLAHAGPALGVHLGLGGIIVGFLPQPAVLAT
jgi:DegV family protein with EDD domain